MSDQAHRIKGPNQMKEKHHQKMNYFKDNEKNEEESESEGETSAMREQLLLKCKCVIENLHHEIEMLTQDKQESEDKTKELLKQLQEAQIRLNQGKQQTDKKESYLEELRGVKDQVQILESRNEELEQVLNEYRSNEDTIVLQLEELTATNKQMQQKIHELTNEIATREHLAAEWHHTNRTINRKIEQLDRENHQLLEENSMLVEILEKISHDLPEGSRSGRSKQKSAEWVREIVLNLQNILQESDSKNQQIYQFQREIQSLKSNNLQLAMALESYAPKHERNEQEDKEILQNNQTYQESQLFQQQEQYPQQNRFSQAVGSQQLPYDDLQAQQQLQEDVLSELRELRSVQERNKDEVERIQTENILLKDQLNALNIQLLSAQIDQGEANSYATANTLLSQQNYASQTQIQQLQTANDFLNESLMACKEELAALQREVQIQFDKEDQKALQAVQKMRHLEAAVRERDLMIGELKEQYEILRTSSARLEDHLPRADTQQQDEELLRINDNNLNLRNQNEMLMKQNKNLESKINDLISENEQLDSMNVRLSDDTNLNLGSQNEMLKKKNQNLENKINDLVTENEHLVSMNVRLSDAVKRESQQRLADTTLIKQQLSQLQQQHQESFLSNNSNNNNNNTKPTNRNIRNDNQIVHQQQQPLLLPEDTFQDQQHQKQQKVTDKEKKFKKQQSPLNSNGIPPLSSKATLKTPHIKKKKTSTSQNKLNGSANSSSISENNKYYHNNHNSAQDDVRGQVTKSETSIGPHQYANRTALLVPSPAISQKNVEILEVIRKRASSSSMEQNATITPSSTRNNKK